MKAETKQRKVFWQKVNQENRIYQSNRLLILGSSWVILFSYQFIKLCQNFSSYHEFKIAVRSTEKTSSLIFLSGIAMGLLLIVLGIRIRKKNI